MIRSAGNFKIANEDQAVVLSIMGEIDHHNAVCLRVQVDKLIAEQRPQKLVLDLSHVDFMDSSGLGFIMGRFTLLKEQGGELVIREPCEGVLKICRLAGLERLIKIEKRGKEKRKG